MGLLFAGALIGLSGLSGLSGLIGDATPKVPSTPVEIGTSGPRHNVSEAGSWQVLITMFALVLVLGAAVLMYAVRQRARVLERRRVRRMGEAVALVAAMGEAGGRAESAVIPVTISGLNPATPSAPPRTTPATPSRPAPNA
jgi:hypothetical protein